MSRKSLNKLAALYGQVERMRLVELQQAAAAVAEAERMRSAGEAECLRHMGEGRAALAGGEDVVWRVSQREHAEAEGRVSDAGTLLAERELVRAGAGDSYRAGRLQTEQVLRVADALRKAEASLHGRRQQAEADDRFAARLCWSRMKTG